MSDNAHQNPNSVEITTIDMGASLKFWVDQAELGMKASRPNPGNVFWSNLSFNGQGNPKPFGDILHACASWMKKGKELEPSVARKTAEDSLKEQPAWSNGSLDS
jgi:hypothetical protein